MRKITNETEGNDREEKHRGEREYNTEQDCETRRFGLQMVFTTMLASDPEARGMHEEMSSYPSLNETVAIPGPQ